MNRNSHWRCSNIVLRVHMYLKSSDLVTKISRFGESIGFVSSPSTSHREYIVLVILGLHKKVRTHAII
jgi:hypothetical protein